MDKFKEFFRTVGEWLVKPLTWLGSRSADKWLHFIAGGLITALAALFPCLAPYAVLFGIAAGALKECCDRLFGWGTAEVSDLAFTVAGSIVAQGFVWLYIVIY